ncbi:MAG: hypothetical protein WB919_00975 [Candidatus Sulfotelmatobacter sp.]
MCRRRTRPGIYYVLIAFLLVPGPISAQSVSSGSGDRDQATIEQLVEQVKQLQQQDRELLERIRILEAKQPQTIPTSEADSTVAATPPQPAQEIPPPQMPTALPRDWHDVHGVQLRGFGEVDYQVLNQRTPELGTGGFVPGSAGNFYTDDFGLFLTSRLNNKASVLSEIIFEEGDAQSYSVNLRRLLFKYDYNEHAKFSLGRYQTNIGYYNWAFPSAAWLQTTADRPLIMKFASDGGLLPTQAIGVSTTGAIPSGKLGLHYIAEYGSSDTIRPDINGDGLLTDENNGNQTNVGLFARPDALRGLQIGSSYYHDQISNNVLNALTGAQVLPPAGSLGPSARYGQTIVNAYAVYATHGIEFLNEGFLIRHALIGGSLQFDTPAFYSQFSKQFGPLRPSFRYQYVNASPNNVIYNDVGLRFGPSFGARYDVNDYMAFTAQLDHTARRSEPDLDGLQLQWAFTF